VAPKQRGNPAVVRVQPNLKLFIFRKMLNLQHQPNNHTTTPHMRVDPTHWGPLSCEGLLCGCCDGVVYESNPLFLN
jgi:hypothetical protein